MKMNNCCIRMKTRITREMPEEHKHVLLALYRYVIRDRKDIFYVIGRTGDMNEVSLTFDSSSNRMDGNKGAKRVTIKTGHEKDPLYCCFVILCRRKRQKGNKLSKERFPVSVGPLFLVINSFFDLRFSLTIYK